MSTSFLTFASAIFSQHMATLITLWQIKLKSNKENGETADSFWNAEEDLHRLTTVRSAFLRLP